MRITHYSGNMKYSLLREYRLLTTQGIQNTYSSGNMEYSLLREYRIFTIQEIRNTY